jgi:neutral trehalase
LAFAQLAEFLGKDYAAEAAPFRHRAAQRRDAINRWCWNEREGIYYDYHAREDRQIAVKHVGIFTTLWAQVANEQQAERLVQEHLLNPEEFARPWPIPALAATEPGYVAGYLPEEERGCCSWRAHTWIPTNYVTFQGLRRYGYIDEALDLAERSRELYFREPFREYYLSDTGNGCGRSPFWGWSGLALFMEEELECGVDATELRNSSHITGSTQC